MMGNPTRHIVVSRKEIAPLLSFDNAEVCGNHSPSLGIVYTSRAQEVWLPSPRFGEGKRSWKSEGGSLKSDFTPLTSSFPLPWPPHPQPFSPRKEVVQLLSIGFARICDLSPLPLRDRTAFRFDCSSFNAQPQAPAQWTLPEQSKPAPAAGR